MRSYTRLEYTSPVESMPQKQEVLGLPVATEGLGVKLILWGCPDCGLTVWDQSLHDRWHARQ